MFYTSHEAELLFTSHRILDQMKLVETEAGDLAKWPAELENLRYPTFDLLISEKSDLGDIGLLLFQYGFWPDILSRLNAQESTLSPFHPVSDIMERGHAAQNIARFLVAKLGAERTVSLMNSGTPLPNSLLFNLKDAVQSFAALQSQQPPSVNLPGDDIMIIIHGTFARNAKWWRPTGGFWNYIKQHVPSLYGDPDYFSWTGDDDDGQRIIAGQELVKWVASHNVKSLDVIAHSHGGNVAFIASQLGVKIRKLINLGTPIRTEYIPNLDNIGALYNVFSTGDWVQQPGAWGNKRGEGRTLADTRKITNRRASNDGHGSNPGHSELHEENTWNASGLVDLL